MRNADNTDGESMVKTTRKIPRNLLAWFDQYSLHGTEQADLSLWNQLSAIRQVACLGQSLPNRVPKSQICLGKFVFEEKSPSSFPEK